MLNNKNKTYLLIGLVFIVGIVVFLYINDKNKTIYLKTRENLINKFNEKIEEKKDVALVSSLLLSQNSVLIKAIQTDNQNLAYNELKNISKIYKEYTKFKNIKIHIHTDDLHSFLRVWNRNKYGDYLGDFRSTIVWVKNNKKPIVSLEIGRAGLAIRGIAPIIQENKYLGSIEVIEGLNSISKDLLKDGINVLILMKKEYLDIAKLFKYDVLVGNRYVLALNPNTYKKTFLYEIQDNISKLNLNYFITDNFFVVKIPLKDFEGNVIGYAVIGERL